MTLGSNAYLQGGFVRLVFDASDSPYTDFQTASLTQLATDTAERAEQLLRSGVTTARDMGGPPDVIVDLRDRIASGAQHGPRLLTAGTP